MQIAKGYVYDYETVVNCFLAVFVNVQNPNDIISFEISDYVNQLDEYNAFLKACIKNKVKMVSYNGLKFDNQISRYVLNAYGKLKNETQPAFKVYETAQEVIRRSNIHEYPMFHNKDNPFRECDILAINNYDNPAKRSSLKWLQYSMDWHNVEDMAKSHTLPHNEQDILLLKAYCINDCLSTRELFIRNKSEILLRGNLSKHFKMDLNNASEPKLAKKIFLKILAERMGVPQHELAKKRTYRKTLALREVILPYIQFKTDVFKKTLSTFKGLVLDGENLKGSFNREVVYRGMPITFALGGIHGAKKGIYQSDKDFIIKSFDVTSYYPNLAIRNKWSPAHIPKELFCEIYESFFEDRKKYSKKDPLNYVYKILLNSTYGLSNEENSFLKDSMFTMRITVNGQLLLVMLMENICESIPGTRPLMINTDGAEIMIPREYEHVYNKLCEEWEKLTMLNLEYENYQKLVTPDINNYIGIYEGKEIPKEDALKLIHDFPKPLIKRTKDDRYILYGTKCKGRFEIDKPLHKNKSYRINRLAYYNYFVHNQQPETTISQNKNIYDYCAGVRAKGEWKFASTCVTSGSIVENNLPKTLRYYVSTKGCKLRKVKEVWGIPEEKTEPDLFSAIDTPNNDEPKEVLLDVKSIKLEADNCMEQIVNRVDPNKSFEEYNIDYKFYIKKIRKEIKNIDPEYSQSMQNFYAE
jgi:hypothetical protein